MILIVHQQADIVIKVMENGKEISFQKNSLPIIFWQIANRFPEEIITWCEQDLVSVIDQKGFFKIFHHDLIMASFAVKTKFLPNAIGYIDQLPFINVNREVQFSTWQMSADIGGIKGKTLLRFKNCFENIDNFETLINTVGKLGQQNGLFCYSSPELVKLKKNPGPLSSNQVEYEKIQFTASNKDVFSFVYSHYKTIRVFILFWCYLKYEKSFPFLLLIKSLFQNNFFKEDIDLSGIEVRSVKPVKKTENIDVIIPTLNRREYLLQVMNDLKLQTLQPKKVILIEQNSEPGAVSQLPEMGSDKWPFEIVHHFIHQTGACNARNLALEEVDSDYVFFADDDIRLNSGILENSIKEMKRLGADCLNLNCKQVGEKNVFHKIKQWGSFGSGTSLVNSDFCKKIRFNKIFEYGFGEDLDYGMQLRNIGCDIVYHPELEILHLKAPQGGFREIIKPPWEKEHPKPSPTLMVYANNYYTPEQLKGYKTELFLRFYSKQEIKNPLTYLKTMRRRWKRSEEWAQKLTINAKTSSLSRTY